MTPSSKKLKLKHQTTISFKKLSEIGVLEIVLKELIRNSIIEKIQLNKEDEEYINQKYSNSNKIKNIDEKGKNKRSNLTLEAQNKQSLTREFKWQKWCMDNFRNRIEEYFLDKKPFLDKYTYSIIRVKNEGLSQELYLRIKEKESDFYKIAKEYSEGIEQKTGGLIGPVNLKNPHPIISNLLKVSQNNQLWPPKKINQWWVIIRLEEKRLATLDSSLRTTLSLELGEDYIKDQFLNYKKEL